VQAAAASIAELPRSSPAREPAPSPSQARVGDGAVRFAASVAPEPNLFDIERDLESPAAMALNPAYYRPEPVYGLNP
jgi:hypothetical protein